MSEFTVSELSKILKEHKRWCDTDGDEGEKTDLSDANLIGAYLSYTDLSRANLSGADLSGACLSEADLRGACLSEANLIEADLSGADLRGADLSDTDLSGADLNETDLSNANLRSANLMRVRGLTIEQLSSVETLCDAELSSERIKQVRKKYPHLLGERGLEEKKLSKSKIITKRSPYKTLSVSQVQSMPNVSIRKETGWGFYGHSTTNHDYNPKAIRGDKVVVDSATGLMWHQSGSDEYMKWNKAKEWIEDLNSEEGYAGYQDWRLPTVDEAASLLESGKKNGNQFIDPAFSKNQRWICTGDKFEFEDGTEVAWHVHFLNGHVGRFYISSYVRPVRSVK
jgi:hypothetical protein